MTFLSRRPWSSSQFVRRWRYQFTGNIVSVTLSPLPEYVLACVISEEEPHGHARITVLSRQCACLLSRNAVVRVPDRLKKWERTYAWGVSRASRTL
jgi:hypothetical protein